MSGCGNSTDKTKGAIERVLKRNGLTAPRIRLAPLLPRREYSGPQARASNELQRVDVVAGVYLKHRRHR